MSVCSKCGQKGHMAYQCFNKLANGKEVNPELNTLVSSSDDDVELEKEGTKHQRRSRSRSRERSSSSRHHHRHRHHQYVVFRICHI